MVALDMAPGHKRSFGFEVLNTFEPTIWNKLKNQAAAKVKPVTFQKIYGSDVDLRAVRIAKQEP